MSLSMYIRPFLWCCAIAAAILAMPTVSVAQGTIAVLHVDAAASTGGNGSSWISGTPYKYLQDALDAAPDILQDPLIDIDTVQIWVRSKWPGGIGIHKYYPDEDEAAGPAPNHVAGDPDESFHLRSFVELYSGFDGTETSVNQRDTHTKGYAILTGDLDGDDNPSPGNEFINYDENSWHVVIGTSVISTARLEGFIVEHGFASQDVTSHSFGGGILLTDTAGGFNPGTPTIRDCIVQDNFAGEGGGGIDASHIAFGALLDIRDCILQRNHADINGGGLHASGDGSCRVVNVTFHDNVGQVGAGAFFAARPSEVINSIFTDNHSPPGIGSGGGLFLVPYDLAKVANSTFSGNQAAHGGAIYLTGGFLGGSQHSTRIDTCTITGNDATSVKFLARGGGILMSLTGGTGTVYVRNSIVWGNTSESTSLAEDQIYKVTSYGSLAVMSSDVQIQTGLYPGDVWPGAGNINADPQFRSSDNLYLAYGSPCVDAGDNSLLPADVADLDGDLSTIDPLPEDLNGSTRIQDGDDDLTATVDMGAYELAPPSTCAPDLNGNCTVNGVDLALLLGEWGPCSGCDEDINGDGVVNGLDLALLLGMWGRARTAARCCCSAAAMRTPSRTMIIRCCCGGCSRATTRRSSPGPLVSERAYSGLISW